VRVDVKITGVDNVLNVLRSLPPEIVSKRGGPVKAALRKGAVVILKQAQMNLYQVTADVSTGDDRGTGLLLKNVIVSRGKAPIGTKGERYLVRVRRKTYPDRQGKPVTTLKTAHLLEYGSSQQKPTPWIRPAVQMKGQQAINTVVSELNAAISRIIKKLERRGR
jgi:HK97 gp10 family phage protein